MKYQVFSDMDGVLVNFEGGVLEYMNKRFQELRNQPDHPDYKLARSAAKELGGWDVEIDRWHIARSDQEGSLKRNYRTAKNFGITSKTSQGLRFCLLRWLKVQRSASGFGLSENWESQWKKSTWLTARSPTGFTTENKVF